MQTTKEVIEIEVQMPDGYRYTRFGIPHLGELYLVDGQVRERRCDASIGMECVIVEKDWVWPKWLKAGWIAMDSDGTWYAWNDEPVYKFHDEWHGTACLLLHPDFFDFTPPPCKRDDAHRSLRANPAYRVLT